MTVTFDGPFLCLNVSFGAENVLKMSQNGKLLILTTKKYIIQGCKKLFHYTNKYTTLESKIDIFTPI